MNDLLADFIGLITDHRAWAGPLVGLIVFGESLAVIGMFFPATPIMFAIGGMMASGAVDPLPVGLWALGGAVLGDWLSYSLGRSVGHKIYYRPPFNRHRRTFAKARLFFRSYGFMSIFLGRFMGPVRATVPLVSGVVRMKRSTFQTANILSALAWVPASFAPGYLALGGLGTARLVTQTQLVAIGGAIALLTIVVAILAPIVSLRRRSRRR